MGRDRAFDTATARLARWYVDRLDFKIKFKRPFVEARSATTKVSHMKLASVVFMLPHSTDSCRTMLSVSILVSREKAYLQVYRKTCVVDSCIEATGTQCSLQWSSTYQKHRKQKRSLGPFRIRDSTPGWNCNRSERKRTVKLTVPVT